VTISLPEGVKPKAVLGEDEISFRGQSVTIPLSDFYGLQTRRFLISCEAPDGADEKIELASVSLAYDEVESGAAQSDRQSAWVGRSADPKTVEASIRGEVAANSAIMQNRLAKERAVKLADAGKSREAAEILLSQAASNASLPAVAQSSLLEQENQVLRDKAEELKNNGSLSKASRKEVQYQNYQDKKQKR